MRRTWMSRNATAAGEMPAHSADTCVCAGMQACMQAHQGRHASKPGYNASKLRGHHAKQAPGSARAAGASLAGVVMAGFGRSLRKEGHIQIT